MHEESTLAKVFARLAELPRIAHLRYRLVNALAGCMPDFWSGAFRSRLYRLAGFNVGSHVNIHGNVELVSVLPGFYQKLSIKQGVTVGVHVAITLDAPVTIGENVSLGPHVRIYTGSHSIGPGSRRMLMDVLLRPVTIEDGAWIAAEARLLPGVTVGRGSIVAAGSVVTEDVPPNTYVEGNPARVVRELPWGDR